MEAPTLTKEFCAASRLHFRPGSEIEVRYIQRRLLDYGFKWADGDTCITQIEKCLERGITLSQQKIYYGLDRTVPWTDASAQQFPDFAPEDLMDETAREIHALRAEVRDLRALVQQLVDHIGPASSAKTLLQGKGMKL